MGRSLFPVIVSALLVACAPRGGLSRRETTFQQKMSSGWAVGEHQDGKKVGRWEYYDADGKLRAAGTYFQGAMHGRWRFCDRDRRCWEVEYWDGHRVTGSALSRLQAEGRAGATASTKRAGSAR